MDKRCSVICEIISQLPAAHKNSAKIKITFMMLSKEESVKICINETTMRENLWI